MSKPSEILREREPTVAASLAFRSLKPAAEDFISSAISVSFLATRGQFVAQSETLFGRECVAQWLRTSDVISVLAFLLLLSGEIDKVVRHLEELLESAP